MKKIRLGAVALCSLLTLGFAVSCTNPANTTVVDRVIIVDPNNGDSSEEGGTDVPGGGEDIPGGGDNPDVPVPPMPEERIKAVDAVAKIYEYAATDGSTPLPLKVYVDNYDQLNDLMNVIRTTLKDNSYNPKYLIDLDIQVNRENVIRLNADVFSPLEKTSSSTSDYKRMGTPQLRSLVLAGVSSIDSNAFENCNKLTNAKIQGIVIGDEIFKECPNLTSVEFLPGAKVIGDNLFYIEPEVYSTRNGKLETLIYPDTVTTLGHINYLKFTALKTVVLPKQNTTPDLAYENAYNFDNCHNLTEVTLPEGMEKLNVYFGNSSNISNIKIPSTVKELKRVKCDGTWYSPFGDLRNLKSIFIPENINDIDPYIFNDMNYLEKIEVDPNNVNYKNIDNHLFNKDGSELLVYCLGDPATEYTIPSSVSKIGYFNDKPDDEKGFKPFDKGFGNLQTIHIPATVKEFGLLSSVNPYGNANINLIFDERTDELTLSTEAFYGEKAGSSRYSQVQWLKTIEIPKNVKLVERENSQGEMEGVFQYCENLERATIKSSVIPKSTFEGLYDLLSVKLIDVKQIGDSAFKNCNQLLSINLDGVTEIGEEAFYRCFDLKNINLSSIKSIGKEAFYDDSSLVNCINLPASLEKIGVGAFRGCGCSFDVNSTNENYKSIMGSLFSKDGKSLIFFADCNCPENGIYLIPDTVETIQQYAFSSIDSHEYKLTSLIIPESVTLIERMAFESNIFEGSYYGNGKLKFVQFNDKSTSWDLYEYTYDNNTGSYNYQFRETKKVNENASVVKDYFKAWNGYKWVKQVPQPPVPDPEPQP